MPTWSDLDRYTEPRRILIVLGGLIAVVVLRGALDATDPDTLGWATYVVQFPLMLALVGLCIGRILVLSHSGVESRQAGEPAVTERFLVIALIIVVVGAPVIRVEGRGDLDAVGLGVQLAATLVLLLIGARWVYRQFRSSSANSVWGWFWVSIAIFVAAGIVLPEDSLAFNLVGGPALVSALLLLIVGIYQAIRDRRR